jgi:hypothetical protein
MIARVRGWHAVLTALPVHAVLSALLLLCPRAALAAEDLSGAAREIAAKAVLLAGAGAPIAVEFRDVSSLGSAGLSQVRAAFENAVRVAGGHIADSSSAVDIHLTVSEDLVRYLLVAEVHRGDERQVWIAGWKRAPQTYERNGSISIEKRQVWEQDEAILDVAFPSAAMLLLSPSKITLLARQNDHWTVRTSLPINATKPLPRDPRGRLRLTGSRFQAFLPGLVCTGATDPELTFECHAAENPWVLESGSRALLLADFAAGANFFDGRVVTQSGVPKNVPPFYTAASLEDKGQQFWAMPLVDGRTLLLDEALNPLSGVPPSIPAWGSDIAGVDSRCGPATQVLATRPSEDEPDAIQSWSLVDHEAVPLTPPVGFPGPVTALWTSGGSAAVAVARDLTTGKYSAYVLTLACGS